MVSHLKPLINIFAEVQIAGHVHHHAMPITDAHLISYCVYDNNEAAIQNQKSYISYLAIMSIYFCRCTFTVRPYMDIHYLIANAYIQEKQFI